MCVRFNLRKGDAVAYSGRLDDERYAYVENAHVQKTGMKKAHGFSQQQAYRFDDDVGGDNGGSVRYGEGNGRTCTCLVDEGTYVAFVRATQRVDEVGKGGGVGNARENRDVLRKGRLSGVFLGHDGEDDVFSNGDGVLCGTVVFYIDELLQVCF